MTFQLNVKIDLVYFTSNFVHLFIFEEVHVLNFIQLNKRKKGSIYLDLFLSINLLENKTNKNNNKNYLKVKQSS